MVDGDPDTILQRDARLASPESFQWLTFGKALNYRLDVPTTGSLYDALIDIATKDEFNVCDGRKHRLSPQSCGAWGSLRCGTDGKQVRRSLTITQTARSLRVGIS